jgi:phosphate/sulfate permease
MEEVKNNAGQNLGIAALITAILTFVLAVIPCVGLIAIIPGIIAIVLASVGLSQASKSNSPQGVPLAGLIIGIVAVLISFSQIFVAQRIAHKADKWPDKIESIMNDVQDNVEKGIKNANISIKVNSDGDTINIVTTPSKKNKEQTLEDLEKGVSSSGDTLKVKK